MIRVQAEDFDSQSEYQHLRGRGNDAGAVVTFVGLVRDLNEMQGVQSLQLEHYEGMTEAVLAELVAECRQRWSVLEARIIHRIGELRPGDQIVFVGISSAHRGDAFAACEFLIDALKTRAPFWKKECYENGAKWLDGRDSDHEKMAQWNQSANKVAAT